VIESLTPAALVSHFSVEFGTGFGFEFEFVVGWDCSGRGRGRGRGEGSVEDQMLELEAAVT